MSWIRCIYAPPPQPAFCLHGVRSHLGSPVAISNWLPLTLIICMQLLFSENYAWIFVRIANITKNMRALNKQLLTIDIKQTKVRQIQFTIMWNCCSTPSLNNPVLYIVCELQSWVSIIFSIFLFPKNTLGTIGNSGKCGICKEVL